MENITPGEVLDELWGIFFLVLKAILTLITRAAHLAAAVILTLARQVESLAAHAKKEIEDWVPVRPAVFQFPNQRNPDKL